MRTCEPNGSQPVTALAPWVPGARMNRMNAAHYLRENWRRASLVGAAILLSAATLFHLYAINLLMPRAYSDLTPRVVGTRDALHGISPYSIRALHDIQRTIYGHVLKPGSRSDPQYFSYPALIVPLLVPAVNLSRGMVSMAFLAFMLPALAVSFWWWTQRLITGLTPLTTSCVVALCISAWPTVWGLRVEQPTDVAFVLMTGAVAAVARGWDGLAGVFFAVAVVKPQIALPLLLWLSVWCARRRRFSIFPGFAVSLGSLWLAADMIVPHWFSSWIASLSAYSSINHPLGEMLLGKWVGLGATSILAYFCVRRLWTLLDAEAASADFLQGVGLALAATILIVPMQVLFLYDQILLVPAVLFAVNGELRAGATSVSRRIFLGGVALGVVFLLISSTGEIWKPMGATWYALPFLMFPLPVAAIMAMLLDNGDAALRNAPVSSRGRLERKVLL